MEPQTPLSSMKHVMSNLRMNIFVKLMVHIYIRWEPLSDDYKGHLCRITIILVKMVWPRFWLKFVCPFLSQDEYFVIGWVICQRTSTYTMITSTNGKEQISKCKYLPLVYIKWNRGKIQLSTKIHRQILSISSLDL